ncbi:hypothetical protein [Nonomuraea jabiensis]|uniref:Uncharacterized protein n=1 Tax=Nonomuraea jabiensis TaxID=882448 RepID=A0A7W9G2N0_9ACTN|nr:hypothetical protein [Nonomuraea jabiensis]MBB5776078.1 hypothetical protein [Nonomuraea jabiensis]
MEVQVAKSHLLERFRPPGLAPEVAAARELAALAEKQEGVGGEMFCQGPG